MFTYTYEQVREVEPLMIREIKAAWNFEDGATILDLLTWDILPLNERIWLALHLQPTYVIDDFRARLSHHAADVYERIRPGDTRVREVARAFDFGDDTSGVRDAAQDAANECRYCPRDNIAQRAALVAARPTALAAADAYMLMADALGYSQAGAQWRIFELLKSLAA